MIMLISATFQVKIGEPYQISNQTTTIKCLFIAMWHEGLGFDPFDN